MTGRRPVRIVLVGGGYAGLFAYRALAARTAATQTEITLVSADDCHNFHGFTGEVVAGLLPPAVTRTPLRKVLPRANFLHGSVTRVDRGRRTVVIVPASGGAARELTYDHLVVGCGAREALDSIPGMAAHGFTLRAPGELDRWLEHLSGLQGRSTGLRAVDSRPVVIAGGGMAGVEIAAAAADRIRAVGAENPVLLVHSGPVLLPGVRADRPAVAARAERELERLGVRVLLGAAVTAIDEDSITLLDGRRLPAVAVLATTGQRPVTLPGLESLPHDERGALVTDPTLAVAPGIWAAGDAARVAHPRSGTPVAANALWAIKAGNRLGRNLARVVNGRRPRAFGYLGLGQAMAFGIGRSATELYGFPIPGVAGWLLRLGFFLRFMPQRRRAAAVVTALVSLPWRGRFTGPPTVREVHDLPTAVAVPAA